VWKNVELWRTAGLGAFICLLLFASTGSAFIRTLLVAGGNATGYNNLAPIVICLIAVAITGVVYSLKSVINPGALPSHVKIKTSALCAAGLLCAAGVTAFGATAILDLAGYTAIGVGLTLIGISYGDYLFGLGAKKLQQTAILAFLGANILWLVMLLIVVPIIQLAVVCLLLSLSIIALPEQVSEEARKEQSDFASADTALAKQWKDASLFKQNWILFLGLVLSFSVQALTWQITLLAASLPATNSIAIPSGNACGSLLAAVLLFCFVLRRPNDWLDKAQAIAPLACVFLISLAWVLNVWSQGPMLLGDPSNDINLFVSNAPVGFATTMLALVLFFRLTTAGLKNSLARLANRLYIVLVSACFLLLVVVQSLLEFDSIGVFEIICRMSYLLGSAVYMAIMLQRKAVHSLLVDIELEGFCEQYKLSKREAIIFKHVLDGRSAPGIAKVEAVALSTVKTHIKHIYEKTGVHKRDDLLELVYKQ
jgi:DNA-binding CsgD family transcriptional regulator